MRITIFLTALCVTGSSWAQVEPWPKRGELFATGIIEEIYFEDEIGEPPEEVGQVVDIYLDTRTEAVSFEAGSIELTLGEDGEVDFIDPSGIGGCLFAPVQGWGCVEVSKQTWHAAVAPGVYITSGSLIEWTFVPVDATTFRRGDCNSDGRFDLADPLRLLLYLFVGTAEPSCADACDANDDGFANISDALASLARLFTGAPELPAPYRECGEDPTPDALWCEGAVCG